MIEKGDELLEKNEIDEALKIYNQALEECQKINYKDAEGELHFFIALILESKREYARALKHYENSLAIYREFRNKVGEANNLLGIGTIYHYMSNYSLALDYLKEALKIYQAINLKSGESQVFLCLGDLFSGKSEHSKAIQYYEESLKIFREIGNEAGKNLALSGISLELIFWGEDYKDVGNYSKALEYYKRALKISREINNKINESLALGHISIIYGYLGDSEKQLDYLIQSLKITEEIKNWDLGWTFLSDMGSIYEYLGYFSEALQIYEKGIMKARNLEDKFYEGHFLTNIGRIYEKLGKYSKSSEYYNQALQIFREINDKFSQKNALANIGRIYQLYFGKYSDALNYYKHALKISEDLGIKSSIESNSLGVAYSYILRGEDNKALPYLKYAIKTLEFTRGKIQEEKYKIKFLEKRGFFYEMIIALFYRLHQKEPHKEYNEEAFLYTEKAKARALLDMLAEAKFGIKFGLSQKDIEFENSLYEEIEIARKFLISAKSEEEKTKIDQNLNRAEEELEEYKLKIKKINPLYASIQYPQPITVEEVQKNILKSKEEALLEYYTGYGNSFLFVITKEKFKILKLPKKNSELAEEIRKLREPFERVEESILELKRLDLKIAHNLYKELIAPAIPYLDGIKHLIIVPHGCLHYLPFEMLITNPVEKKTNENVSISEYQNPHYLIEEYSISYSPSASVLDPKLLYRKRTNPQKGELIAFANPDFGDISQEETEETTRNLFLTKAMRQRIEELPYAEQEVEEIKKYYRNPLILKKKEAKEESFVKNSAYYPVIHLSTHGFLNEAHPIYSGIVFSYNEEIKDVDLLHAYEIFNLDLNCDLVTLSACETALGQEIEKIGGEGVVGLTRSFLYAGAESLVVSLWKVEDESTSYLMSEFYKNMREKGLSKVEALRQAKLSLIKKEKKIEGTNFSYSHPFFWAPFILVGDWK
ncbi:MAG: CHAT domain-containing protein [Methanosarcinales archaeon]